MVTGRRSGVRHYKEKRRLSFFGRIILPLCVVLAVCLLYFSVRLFFYSPDESLNDYGKKDYIEAEQNVISHKNDKKIYEEETSDEDAINIGENLTENKKNLPKDEVKPKKKTADVTEKPQKTKETVGKSETKKNAAKLVGAEEPEKIAKDTKVPQDTKKSDKNIAVTKAVGEATENKDVSVTGARDNAKTVKENPNAVKSDKDKVRVANAESKNTKSGNEKDRVKKSETSEKTAASSRWDVQIGGFTERERALNLIKDAEKSGFAAYMTDSEKDGKPFYKVRVKGEEEREKSEALKSRIEAAGFPVYLVHIKK
ncbi:MAG: SPOR domain-containing protein [Synergistes sp.]|nr:SPOR domain-containing protein [Synergistes sp.]